MQMVLMLESGWVQLREKHLGQMTEMNSAHLKEKLKALRLGCLSAELTEMQMVKLKVVCSLYLMETQMVLMTEMNLVQLTENLKEIRLVYL